MTSTIPRDVAIRHALAMRTVPTVDALQRVCRAFGLQLQRNEATAIIQGAKYLRGDV